jgi:hypothetical protein
VCCLRRSWPRRFGVGVRQNPLFDFGDDLVVENYAARPEFLLDAAKNVVDLVGVVLPAFVLQAVKLLRGLSRLMYFLIPAARFSPNCASASLPVHALGKFSAACIGKSIRARQWRRLRRV